MVQPKQHTPKTGISEIPVQKSLLLIEGNLPRARIDNPWLEAAPNTAALVSRRAFAVASLP